MDMEYLTKVEPQRQRIIAESPDIKQLPEPIQLLLALKRRFWEQSQLQGSLSDPLGPTLVDVRNANFLSAAFTNFRDTFERLFEAGSSFDPSPSGITPADLDGFRTRHSNTPYLCRLCGCTCALFGFSSAVERDDHELRHEWFRCAEPECDFFDTGESFSQQAALRRHVENHHNRKDNPSQGSDAKVKVPTFLPLSSTGNIATTFRTKEITEDSPVESETGLLAQLFGSCVVLLKSELKEMQSSQASDSAIAATAKLRRALNTLQLWGDAYQVEEGYLDRLLGKSLELQRTTATLLYGFGDILSSCRCLARCF